MWRGVQQPQFGEHPDEESAVECDKPSIMLRADLDCTAREKSSFMPTANAQFHEAQPNDDTQ